MPILIRVKKILITTALLGSASFAAADSLGLSGTYNKGFYKADGDSVDVNGAFGVGLSYTYDLDAASAIRAELELLPNLYESDKLGFGAEFTYLRSVMTSGEADVYFGGGLGFNTVADTATSNGVTTTVRVTAINPTLLAGARFAVAPGFSAFAELAGGPSFLRLNASSGGQSESTTINGAFLKPRLGFTYTLR